jgi:hypothetical protein
MEGEILDKIINGINDKEDRKKFFLQIIEIISELKKLKKEEICCLTDLNDENKCGSLICDGYPVSSSKTFEEFILKNFEVCINCLKQNKIFSKNLYLIEYIEKVINKIKNLNINNLLDEDENFNFSLNHCDIHPEITPNLLN